jgi:hypothetical protein
MPDIFTGKKLPISLLVIILTGFFIGDCLNDETGTGLSQERWPGWRTNLEKRSIDLNELISGGPPKDGIPAIYSPQFVSLKEAEQWLKPREPVISLVVGSEARAYPLQILMWHELVNDSIAEIPVAVTFCPLCYSAIVFDRTVGGRKYTFGVSGLLRNSDLIMYDRETESLWQQVTGEAIVGDLNGVTLKQLPTQIIAFEQFSNAYPQGVVLSRDTGYTRDYGRNPYVGYDDISRSPFLFRGKPDGRLPPMEKIIALSINDVIKAYPYTITKKAQVIHDTIGEQTIVIFHGKGAVSALDRSEIYSSREEGSTGVFDTWLEGRALTFNYSDGRFVDKETKSVWDITGQAIAGKLKGKKLAPIVHGDYFAFAWLAFKPETIIYGDI